MNIATALNRKYLEYTCVMLTSLCENQKEHVDAYLLHSDLTDADFEIMRQSLRCYGIDLIPLKVEREKFGNRLPHNDMWTLETYFRLMLLDMLPAEVDRLLYLDVDLIINKSLDDLYHTDFENAVICAAMDSNGIRVSEETFSPKQCEMFRTAFAHGHRYFNAGVMLMNISELRKEYDFDVYMDLIREWNYEMTAPDQDILNYAHWGKVKYIRWEVYDLFARIAHNHEVSVSEVQESTAIIHYAGSKPWSGDNVHYPIEQIWWDYAKLTPFYHKLLEDFQVSQMTDRTVENYIYELQDRNTDLQNKMNELMETCKKLMNRFS